LSKRAKAGVEVVLVLDAFGSRELKQSSIKTMKDAGVEVLFFSDRIRRTHRKIIVIDDKISFFGGANIKQNSKQRLDLQARLAGKIVSKPFLRSFSYTYKMCGGKNKHILHHCRKSFFGKIKSFIIENLPGHKQYKLTDYYKEQLLKAKKSIKITTPYFIPPRRLMALLDNALRRGVNIDIIIPYDTDIKTLNKINYHYIDKLMPLGIHFYAIPQMNHSKILIIDDKEGLIGSQNVDYLSMQHNIEVGAFFKQKDMVQNLLKIFEKRKKQSKPYKDMDIRLTLKDRIFGRFFRAFFYFM
jgi:cardiolipin synthase